MTFKEYLILSITEELRDGEDLTQKEIDKEIQDALKYSKGSEEEDEAYLVDLLVSKLTFLGDIPEPGVFLYRKYTNFLEGDE